MGQPLDLLDEPRVGGRERVVQVEHAGERARRVDHRHVAKAVAAHHADRLVQRLIDRDRGHRPGHQQGDRLVGDRAPGYPAGHVLLGEDAGQALLAVDHNGGQGRRLGHAGDDLACRHLVRDDHRRRLHVLADAPAKRRGLRMRHA